MSAINLSAAIVEAALRFTAANDHGDEIAAQLEDSDLDDDAEESLCDASDEADNDYNREKSDLFVLCRELSAVRVAIHRDTRTEDMFSGQEGGA